MNNYLSSASSCLLALITLLSASVIFNPPVSAQDSLVCNRYSDDNGFVDKTYVINGVVYRVFTIKETNEIVENLKLNKENKEIVTLLEQKVKIQDQIIKENNFHIGFLENRINEYQEQINHCMDKKASLINPTTGFIAGVATCSATYGFWNYSNNRR